MKVQPLINTTYSTTKALNFNGLSKVTKKVSCNDALYLDFETEYYHPFKDETQEMINKKERSFSGGNYRAEWYETGEATVEISKTFVLKDRLPFSAEEYSEYKRLGYVVPEQRNKTYNLVDKGLRDTGLYEYLHLEPKVKKVKGIFRKLFRCLK